MDQILSSLIRGDSIFDLNDEIIQGYNEHINPNRSVNEEVATEDKFYPYYNDTSLLLSESAHEEKVYTCLKNFLCYFPEKKFKYFRSILKYKNFYLGGIFLFHALKDIDYKYNLDMYIYNKNKITIFNNNNIEKIFKSINDIYPREYFPNIKFSISHLNDAALSSDYNLLITPLRNNINIKNNYILKKIILNRDEFYKKFESDIIFNVDDDFHSMEPDYVPYIIKEEPIQALKMYYDGQYIQATERARIDIKRNEINILEDFYCTLEEYLIIYRNFLILIKNGFTYKITTIGYMINALIESIENNTSNNIYKYNKKLFNYIKKINNFNKLIDIEENEIPIKFLDKTQKNILQKENIDDDEHIIISSKKFKLDSNDEKAFIKILTLTNFSNNELTCEETNDRNPTPSISRTASINEREELQRNIVLTSNQQNIYVPPRESREQIRIRIRQDDNYIPLPNIINNITKITNICFDLIAYEEINNDLYLKEDKNNIILFFGDTSNEIGTGYSKIYLEDNLKDPYKRFYECYPIEDRSTNGPINRKKTIIKIDTRSGPIFVPINDVVKIINEDLNETFINSITEQNLEFDKRIFFLKPTNDKINITGSENAMATDTHNRYVSADHCQEGTQKKIHRLLSKKDVTEMILDGTTQISNVDENPDAESMPFQSGGNNKIKKYKYKNKYYKIRTGPKGGKFIIVDGKNINLRKKSIK